MSYFVSVSMSSFTNEIIITCMKDSASAVSEDPSRLFLGGGIAVLFLVQCRSWFFSDPLATENILRQYLHDAFDRSVLYDRGEKVDVA